MKEKEKPKREIHGDFVSIFKKAATIMSIGQPLYAQLMYSLVNEVSTGIVPTAATSGVKRYFDRGFMEKMEPRQQAFVMAHEIAHEMLMHKPRRQGRDHQLWNYACDIKINNLLIESGAFTKPSEGVFDHNGERFIGKSEEFIYDFIEEQQKNGKDGVPGGYEGDMIGEEMTQEEVAQAAGRLQAAIEMHGMGNLPTEMQAAIGLILNPKEQWYDWLRKFFTSKAFSGCDWKSSCRREFARTGLISPPFQSDSMGTVVVSVDQSGSISQEVLDHFAGHINSILMECKPEKVVLQYFDTQVHETEEFKVEDLPILLRRVCGGGTSFVDCCEKAEEHDATVHIVLTDMMGSFPGSSNICTIWADIDGGGRYPAPFGEHVHIEMEG